MGRTSPAETGGPTSSALTARTRRDRRPAHVSLELGDSSGPVARGRDGRDRHRLRRARSTARRVGTGPLGAVLKETVDGPAIETEATREVGIEEFTADDALPVRFVSNEPRECRCGTGELPLRRVDELRPSKLLAEVAERLVIDGSYRSLEISGGRGRHWLRHSVPGALVTGDEFRVRRRQRLRYSYFGVGVDTAHARGADRVAFRLTLRVSV